jgi:hypothetical protein
MVVEGVEWVAPHPRHSHEDPTPLTTRPGVGVVWAFRSAPHHTTPVRTLEVKENNKIKTRG